MDQKHLTWLLEKLQSPDDVEHLGAAELLAGQQTTQAIEPLLLHLDDRTYAVRVIAAWALRHLSDGRAVEPLIAVVQNKKQDDRIRAAAASSLGELGDARAVEPLIKSLRPPQKDFHRTQAAAAEALGRLGDRRAVKPLLSCLSWKRYPWGNVRLQAVRALAHLDDRRTVEPFLTFFQETSYEPLLADAAMPALAKLGEAGRAVDLLLPQLHTQPLKRLSIIIQLGQSGDARALTPLVAALQDPVPQVRVWATLALHVLIQHLQEREEVADWQEAEVRRQIEEIYVGEQLIQCLAPSDAGASAMLEALKEYDLARSTELLLPYAQDRRVEIWTTAAWALAHLGDARAVEPLIACLGVSQNLSIRSRSIEALGRLGDARAVEPIIACLGSDVQAVYALGRLKDARAVEPLCAYLQDRSYGGWRRAAASALGQIGDARAVEPLIACFGDLPREAVEALGQVGDARAIEPLHVLLRSLDAESVRLGMNWEISRALFQLEWRLLGP